MGAVWCAFVGAPLVSVSCVTLRVFCLGGLASVRSVLLLHLKQGDVRTVWTWTTHGMGVHRGLRHPSFDRV